MSRRRVGAGVVVAAAAAAAALTGVAATGPHGSREAARAGEFTLRGHVAGLYPGAGRRFVIVIRNRGRRPLHVRSITTRVGDARPGCRRGNVRVSAFRGRLRVGPGRTRRVRVRVSMRPTSPDACQGAVFPLVFRGRATR